MSEAQCPIFPMRREQPLDPPREYAEFRREPGLKKARLWNGTTTWLATRYEDARAILADSDTFSIVSTRSGYPMIAPGRAEFLLKERPTLVRLDPPEHTALRRMLTREFAVKRIQAMRPKVESMVDELLDQMAEKDPPTDLVTAFALPLPTIVISELLGIPYEDHEFFQERSAAKLNLDSDPAVPRAAQEDILAYFDQLLRTKESAGSEGEDILSRLVREQVLPGHLSHEDAVAMAELLVVAGHETTANMIALGLLVLFQNPDQFELLKRDRSLTANAVEEMLRFLSIAHLNGARVAKKDTVLGGQAIRAGEGIFALLPAANRDAAAFPDPDRFDITRSAAHHVTFGFGVHQCMGQGLARLELEIAFDRLFSKFPNLRLAIPFEQVPFKYDSFVFGVKCLPVSW